MSTVVNTREISTVVACTLCQNAIELRPIAGPDHRAYFHCPRCHLIFVDAAHRCVRDEEERQYRLHRNSIHDSGYVTFLSRVIDPMIPLLRPGMRGLDFGCGPGPTLSEIVRRQGWDCDDFDPIFRNIPLRAPYDFIFATECAEHFFAPDEEFGRLCQLLVAGGYLGIMTKLWTDLEVFRHWHYARDITHVSFFHASTLVHICAEFDLQQVWSDNDRVFILQKSVDSSEQQRS